DRWMGDYRKTHTRYKTRELQVLPCGDGPNLRRVVRISQIGSKILANKPYRGIESMILTIRNIHRLIPGRSPPRVGGWENPRKTSLQNQRKTIGAVCPTSGWMVPIFIK